jgi:hypothetical protein
VKEDFGIIGELARRNRLPAGIAVCHIRIIARGVGAIIPGLPGVGPRAIAIVGTGAIIAAAGIVAVMPIVGIVAVIPEVVIGIAVTPPIRRVDPSEPEPAAEMPKAMVGPAAMKPGAVKAAAVEPGKPAAVKAPTPAVNPPAAIAAVSRIGRRWLNNSGGK